MAVNRSDGIVGENVSEESMLVINEFRAYRKLHPGSKSFKAMEFWLKNGKEDRADYRWDVSNPRKRNKRKPFADNDLRNKLLKVKKVDELPAKEDEDKSGGKM